MRIDSTMEKIKARRWLITGILSIILAFFLTIVGDRIGAEGQNLVGIFLTVVGYIIPVYPIYMFYKNFSNKKIAGFMVLGWGVLSLGVFWPDYNILRLLGGSLTAITSLVAVFDSIQK